MKKNQIKTFIELGPGKVLSGMTQRIAREAKIINIDKVEDIENFKNEF